MERNLTCIFAAIAGSFNQVSDAAFESLVAEENRANVAKLVQCSFRNCERKPF
jgi:hypothetical protein